MKVYEVLIVASLHFDEEGEPLIMKNGSDITEHLHPKELEKLAKEIRYKQGYPEPKRDPMRMAKEHDELDVSNKEPA